VGRLSFEKGYNYALHACKLLKNSGFKFKYHILGDGPDKCILQYIINDLGLLNDVELYGKVNGDKVNQILQQSDIFLLPSIYEGISNAALEAMASGVPIISTDAGGMEEVIEDGVNGRIVKRYNSIELYNALTWMILNYGKSIIMADEAVITIKNNHTHDNQISKYLNYYETLLL
jgi:colanic acid/amylovoran biosynthesis glycosyltransferase